MSFVTNKEPFNKSAGQIAGQQSHMAFTSEELLKTFNLLIYTMTLKRKIYHIFSCHIQFHIEQWLGKKQPCFRAPPIFNFVSPAPIKPLKYFSDPTYQSSSHVKFRFLVFFPVPQISTNPQNKALLDISSVHYDSPFT